MNRTGDSKAWSWPDSPGWRKASIKSEAGKRNEESLYTQLLKLTGYTVKWKKQGAEESKDWCWSWNSNTLATSCEELTQWKRPWCWERLKAGGEGDDRGWDGWMASPTPWTWVWASSGSWWWTGGPGVLQSLGSQRFRHDWETELNWTELTQTLTQVLHFLRNFLFGTRPHEGWGGQTLPFHNQRGPSRAFLKQSAALSWQPHLKQGAAAHPLLKQQCFGFQQNGSFESEAGPSSPRSPFNRWEVNWDLEVRISPTESPENLVPSLGQNQVLWLQVWGFSAPHTSHCSMSGTKRGGGQEGADVAEHLLCARHDAKHFLCIVI